MPARLVSLLALLILPCVGCEKAGPFDPSEIDCVGNFSYEEVNAWARGDFNHVFAVAGVTMTYVDEAKVCLAVGVETWSVVPAVESKLKELGIPRSAVYIKIQAPFTVGG